ncbi:MAG: hypothetical protein MUC92_13835, partial [Fimbriimonadaceae bacterium]|nr:hypothetical protein [Fimbriimonadaceae bacterium]
MAKQLETRDLLDKIYTGYPRQRIERFELPPDKVHCHPSYLLVATLLRKAKLVGVSGSRRLEYHVEEELDRYVATRL